MARGCGAGGKRDKGGYTPDWLQPNGPPDGGGGAQQQEPRRRPRGDDDQEDPKAKKKIKWGPCVLLVLIVLPGLLPTLLDMFGKLQNMGYVASPKFTWLGFNPNPYQACLQEFYADHAPEKLGNLDATLAKYEGREKSMFSTLGKKYAGGAHAAKRYVAKCASAAKAAKEAAK